VSIGLSRRRWFTAAAATVGTAACISTSARIVVVGGGFTGASAARTLKELDPSLNVTLIEPNRQYRSAPGTNLVIAGEWDLDGLSVGFDGLKQLGIDVIHETVSAIDPDRRLVLIVGGLQLNYDRLIVATGVSLRFEAINGLSLSAVEQVPHGWWPGEQTLLLRLQVEYMPDGGTFVICPPAGLFQGHAAPYARKSDCALDIPAQTEGESPDRRSFRILCDAGSVSRRMGQAVWRENRVDRIGQPENCQG